MGNNSLLNIRLLLDNITEPFKHFSVEETILRSVEEKQSPNTLRIRRYEPSVWIGVNQYPEEDVDIAYCEKNGIKVIRRPNPGGAVYQDQGSFCFSLFCNKETLFNHLEINDPLELYKKIGNVIIKTCEFFGVTAKHSGVNDITINGRKVYGSAQLEFYDTFMHSGTFLINTDIDIMVKTLQPSKLKFIDKGFSNIRDRVVNLSEACKRNLEVKEVIDVFTQTLREELRLHYDPITKTITNVERNLAEELFITKYSKKEWTFRTRPQTEYKISTKAKSGIITISIAKKEEKIESFILSGDFLIPNQNIISKIQKQAIGKSVAELIEILMKSELPTDVLEAMINILK
ncbi:MAG: biotin/lipoate A/B protein ligase family protein [Candidatus Thorarchaeota archaeon]